MSSGASARPLPEGLLDALLQRAPLHVFVFDRGLSCRYAAPFGSAFLGLMREEMLGRAVAEIVPPVGNGLHSALERVAAEGATWRHPGYRYRHRGATGEMLYVWSVQAEPVAIERERGVLLMLQDVIDSV